MHQEQEAKEGEWGEGSKLHRGGRCGGGGVGGGAGTTAPASITAASVTNRSGNNNEEDGNGECHEGIMGWTTGATALLRWGDGH